jgi:hypothetical protein
MYLQRIVRQALRLGLLVILVVLAMNACGGGGEAAGGGGGEEQAKARPLPQDPEALRPGQYRTEGFEPSLSFTVGKGWSNAEAQLSDYIYLGQGVSQGEERWVRFANVKEVYKPGTLNVVKAPKDLVGWFQHHPYLKTGKPEPVTVGVVKGEQFDVLVEDLPQDFYGECGRGCVDIASLSNDEQLLEFREGKKRRVIVLEDVKGSTVTIDFGSIVADFDNFLPEAQKVVDSVKWGDS